MEGRAHNFNDLSGQRFGRLVVVELDRVEHREPFWKCKCDCGKSVVRQGRNVSSGGTRSCGCLKLRPPGETGFNRILNDYIGGAQKRGLNFSLTPDEFRNLTQQNCHYCQIPPSKFMIVGNANSSFTYNGIDRKDNGVGYELENCVSCCHICNRGKGALSYEVFMTYIERIRNGR